MRELKPELEPALSLEPVGLGFENIGEVWRSAWVNSSSGSSFGSIIGTPFAAAELEGPSCRNGTRDPIFTHYPPFFFVPSLYYSKERPKKSYTEKFGSRRFMKMGKRELVKRAWREGFHGGAAMDGHV
nr:hypothetical protein Itr_chr13CG07680 [Ipomoea trifida]